MSSLSIHNNILKDLYINYLSMKGIFDDLMEIRMFVNVIRNHHFITYKIFFNEYIAFSLRKKLVEAGLNTPCNFLRIIELLNDAEDELTIAKGEDNIKIIVKETAKLDDHERQILGLALTEMVYFAPIPFLQDYYDYLEKEMLQFPNARQRIRSDAKNLLSYRRSNADLAYFDGMPAQTKQQVTVKYQKYILDGIISPKEYVNKHKIIINCAFLTFSRSLQGYNNLKPYFSSLLGPIMKDLTEIPNWKEEFHHFDPTQAYLRILREERDIFKQLDQTLKPRGKSDYFIVQLKDIASKRTGKYNYFDFVRKIQLCDIAVGKFLRRKYGIEDGVLVETSDYVVESNEYEKKRNEAIDILNWQIHHQFFKACEYSETVLQKEYDKRGLHYIASDKIVVMCRNTLADILTEALNIFERLKDKDKRDMLRLLTFVYDNLHRFYYKNKYRFNYKNIIAEELTIDNYLSNISESRSNIGLAQSDNMNVVIQAPIRKLFSELYHGLKNSGANPDPPLNITSSELVTISPDDYNLTREEITDRFMDIYKNDKLFNMVLEKNKVENELNVDELFFLAMFWKEKYFTPFATVPVVTGFFEWKDEDENIVEVKELIEELELTIMERIHQGRTDNLGRLEKLRVAKRKKNRLERKKSKIESKIFKKALKDGFERKHVRIGDRTPVEMSYTLKELKGYIQYVHDKMKSICRINPWETIVNLRLDIQKQGYNPNKTEVEKHLAWLHQLKGLYSSSDRANMPMDTPFPLSVYKFNEKSLKVVNNDNLSFEPDISMEGEWIDLDAVAAMTKSHGIQSSAFEISIWKEKRRDNFVGVFKTLLKVFSLVKLNKMNPQGHADFFMRNVLTYNVDITKALSELSPFLANGDDIKDTKDKKFIVRKDMESMLAVLYFILSYATNRNLKSCADTTKLKIGGADQPQMGKFILKKKVVLKTKKLKIGKVTAYDKETDTYTIMIQGVEDSYDRDDFITEKDLKKITVLVTEGEKKGMIGNIFALGSGVKPLSEKEKTRMEVAMNSIEELKKEKIDLQKQANDFDISSDEAKIGDTIFWEREVIWINRYRGDIVKNISKWKPNQSKDDISVIATTPIPKLNSYIIKLLKDNPSADIKDLIDPIKTFCNQKVILSDYEKTTIVDIRRTEANRRNKELEIVNDKIKRLRRSLYKRKYQVELQSAEGELPSRTHLDREEFIIIDNIRSWRDRVREGLEQPTIDDIAGRALKREEKKNTWDMVHLMLDLKEDRPEWLAVNVYALVRYVYYKVVYNNTSVKSADAMNYIFLLFHYSAGIINKFQMDINDEYTILLTAKKDLETVKGQIKEIKGQAHNRQAANQLKVLQISMNNLTRQIDKLSWLKNYKIERNVKIERQEEAKVDDDAGSSKKKPIMVVEHIDIEGDTFYKGWIKECISRSHQYRYLTYDITSKHIHEVTKRHTKMLRAKKLSVENEVKNRLDEFIIPETKDIITKFLDNIYKYG